MKRILLLCVLSTACATHQLPPRIISTDWSTVEALSPGTNVALTLKADEIQTGEIKGVTATAIALREARGVSIIARAEIWRVTVRDPAGSSRWPRVLQTAAIGAAVTALPAYIATANYENGSHAGPLQFVLLGTGVGAAIGAMRASQQAFHERLVYVKP